MVDGTTVAHAQRRRKNSISSFQSFEIRCQQHLRAAKGIRKPYIRVPPGLFARLYGAWTTGAVLPSQQMLCRRIKEYVSSAISGSAGISVPCRSVFKPRPVTSHCVRGVPNT